MHNRLVHIYMSQNECITDSCIHIYMYVCVCRSCNRSPDKLYQLKCNISVAPILKDICIHGVVDELGIEHSTIESLLWVLQ